MRIREVEAELRARPATWLVTGAAGFIGSHLVERLLGLDQEVVGLDNFATGHRSNLEELRRRVGSTRAARFRFLEGDLRDPEACRAACRGVERVLHQAALGSVPRSLEDPLTTHAVNVDGFVHMLLAAREAGVRRFVYASSSAVYGDHPGLPKREPEIGRALSPYAVSKRVNEIYAGVFQDAYGLESVGLRYFNVFGSRQDPEGPYAAVIPRWVRQLLRGEPCVLFGDGETSRDFCHVDNAVQANLLAATCPAEATNDVYNVSVGGRTTLAELHRLLRERVARYRPDAAAARPEFADFRPGDVRHSQADIAHARARLGYEPEAGVEAGLDSAVEWFAGGHS